MCCRNFVFTPDVPICVDYVAKHIDIEQKLPGIIGGLGHLTKAELRLKSLHFKQG